mmetsp:Transcript_50319/g.93031  ORF Transcript_50319/g.93031 Transcript_50319/m.93031 type:complete len:217 (+) Transcript_50319:151-801(+)
MLALGGVAFVASVLVTCFQHSSAVVAESCEASMPANGCSELGPTRVLMQQTARARQPPVDVYATPLSAAAEEANKQAIKQHSPRFVAADQINEDLGPAEVILIASTQTDEPDPDPRSGGKPPQEVSALSVSAAKLGATAPADMLLESRRARSAWEATSSKLVVLLDGFFLWPEEVTGQSALVQQVVSFTMLALFIIMVVAAVVFVSVWKVPQQRRR